MNKFLFGLGEEAKDVISGFKGIIIGCTQYLTGCNTYAVQPRGLDKDKRPCEAKWFDETSLVNTSSKRLVLQKEVITVEKGTLAEAKVESKGGPCNTSAPLR